MDGGTYEINLNNRYSNAVRKAITRALKLDGP